MKPDRIVIRDLRLRCIIGVEPWERKTLQEVEIQITLDTRLRKAGKSDDLAKTINYRTLTKQIIALVEGSAFQLVEALAQAIADLCLKERRVRGVKVRVEKPGALRFARTVGVVIRRTRA